MADEAPIIRFSGVSKHFGETKALQEVDFSCRSGSIHAILGENGAGKSTLIKIMSGVLPPSAGELQVAGKPVRFRNPTEASDKGIVCIFQELSLVPDLSVADNICLADPPRKWGMVDRRKQCRIAEELLARIHCEDVNPYSLVRDLSLSRRQMVEIAKALGKDPRVLILDEATSALTSKDVETIYDLLGELKSDGVASIFISHRMHEVERLCDTLSVFRNGRHIDTFAKGERTDPEIVHMMIGREVTSQYPPKRQIRERQESLAIRSLEWEGKLRDVNLTMSKGEILGLGGLDGQGQKELLLALFGVLRDVEGDIRCNGIERVPRSPHEAKSAPLKIALVPEDRKTEGLMLPMSIADNMMIASLSRVTKGPFLSGKREKAVIEEGMRNLRVKAGSPDDPVSTLSGGNQQKVVIAKWLATDPEIILLNDPTRGIDVGTKQEIYHLLQDLAEQGKSILLYSTDYAELIGCCDRVAIMYDGHIVAELEGDQITEEAIVSASLNIATGPATATQDARI
jgi:ribose transport system ATP-binding protein